MEDDKPPLSVSSSAWTGPPPNAPQNATDPSFRARWNPGEVREQSIAGLLLAVCLLAFFVWYAVLGSHSAVAPSPETGRTEALLVFSPKGPPIYVTPTEALITYGLLVAAFAVPVAYLLGSEAIRRRSKR